MTVTIVLQRPNGEIITQFIAEDAVSLAQMARYHGIPFPVSCGKGMCGICKCKILGGHEHIQIDKITTPIKPLERYDDGTFKEVFACVGGIKTDAINDTIHHKVILEKYL